MLALFTFQINNESIKSAPHILFVHFLSYLPLCLPIPTAKYLFPNSQALTYTNCSSIYCSQCLNQYQCSVCLYNQQPICCPKFCLQCLDMNTCIKCQPYFTLSTVGENVVCTRINQFTDANCINGTYVQPVTFSCFSCNFPNCAKCTSYQNCSQCEGGYFLWNGTSTGANPFNLSQTILIQIVSQCLACMSNCIKCSNQTICTQCALKYFFNGTSCIMCSGQYCLTCSITPSNCTKCLGGTYLNTSNCILCSSVIANCSNCIFQSNTVTCTDCAYNLYWNGSKCLECGDDCKLCSLVQNATSSVVFCYQCNDNFAINNQSNLCVPCMANCLECYFNTSQSTKTSCSLCDLGYVANYNSTTQLFYCQSCQFPCVQCYNDSSACARCDLGFYLNLQSQDQKGNTLTIGKCYFCSIQNCVMCSSATICTECSDGYFIKFQSGTKSQTCSPCISPCMLCVNKNVTSSNATNQQVQCTQCLPGYTFLPNNNQTCVSCNNTNCLFCRPQRQKECVQCEPGYKLSFLPTGTVCVSCPLQNCLFCLQNQQTLGNGSVVPIDTCGQCSTTYYLQQSTTQNYSYCVQCSQGCATCQNGTYCNNCSDGFYLSQQSSSFSQCLKCPSQCLTCNFKGCIFCADNYYPSPLQSSISSISPQLVQCLSCNVIEGCLSCYNQQFCKQCTSFMFSVLPGIQGNCMPCPDACIQCDNQQACLVCEDGYLLIDQTNTCLQQTGWPIWAIFTACTLGFSLIFVLVEKGMRRFNRKTLERHDYSHEGLQFQETDRETSRKNEQAQ